MTAYLGIDGTARRIAGGYVGVDGVARKITKAYVGVDGVARLWWAADAGGAPIVLEVEKVTADTYAGETTYTGEQFILLDIYPKTNGTVSVTYGGLTKTVTDTSGAENPNAQEVYFGTFNGVSDSVATPESGTLTIEGDYRSFACGGYQIDSKLQTRYCGCITAVDALGDLEYIADRAFSDCAGLTSLAIPDNIASIGDYAFYYCTNLALTSLPSSVVNIGNSAFYYCKNVCIQTFHEGIVSIGDKAFYMEQEKPAYTAMYGKTITLPSTLQSIGSDAFTTEKQNDAGNSRNCYLAGVEILATTPPTLGENVPFTVSGDFRETFRITVPKGCGELYNSAWTLLVGRIVEAS